MPLFVPPTALPITTVSANTTLDTSHYTVLVDASGGARTISLPAATTCPGRLYTIKKGDSSGNVVTVDGDGSETIDGQITQSLDAQWESITIQSTGSAWNIA